MEKKDNGEKDIVNKKISVTEYERLAKELTERVDWIYSHGYKFISAIFVLWAAMLALIGMLFTEGRTSIMGMNVWVDVAVTLAVVTLCGAPVLIVYPCAFKYRDNLRQVGNIARYIHIFMEAPSILKGEKEFFGWEMLHKANDKKINKGVSVEYLTIAILSCLFLTFVSIGLHGYLFLHFSEEKIILGASVYLSTLYLGYIVYKTVQIYRYTATNKWLKSDNEQQFEYYLKMALQEGVLTEEECEKVRKYEQERLNVNLHIG